MPHSWVGFKSRVQDWIKSNVSTDKRILDVGPGAGTYADLLSEYSYQMDAVEIFAPYIQKFNLREKYDNVYVGDIRTFNISDYDFTILGDVLEHLNKQDAIALIDNIKKQGKECLVAVPYKMEQGEWEGNIHETHLQTDLTHEMIGERYPDLKLLCGNKDYGYYVYMKQKLEKAYVLYANSAYYNVVCEAVKSINIASNIPVIVYMINSDWKVPGAYKTIKWDLHGVYVQKNKYIDRNDTKVFKLLAERPRVIADALDNHAKTIAYIDSDTIVTKYIDEMFKYYPEDCTHPYFVQGIYDYLFINGRGGVETREELYKSLEHAACELFGVDQNVRDRYRQTGYFVAGQHSRKWIDEWMWMCSHPAVVKNPQLYAPYHEETLANVLLWKYNIHEGLPLMYMNYKGEIDVNSIEFTGEMRHESEWVAVPAKKEQLMAFHGEKDITIMQQMISKLSKRVLFLAPHLSTGGMPEFLLKRIKALSGFNIYVVEWANYSDEYVVQKNQIKKLVDNFYTLGADKTDLIDIIRENNIDIVHIDEMGECLGDGADDVLPLLYANDRSWKIIETCHNISFNADSEKTYHPDAYAFCTPYHLETFANMPSYKGVIEFPIDPVIYDWQSKLNAKYDLQIDPSKKHVVNIGLWTRGKNQGEGLALAKKFPDVEFHFVGNQAVNFKDYWEPLMKELPSNVTVWGERSDTDKFLLAADVFMFNSTWECNPLVLREAISYGLPILARNLPQYKDMFTAYIEDLHPMKMKNQLQSLLSNKEKRYEPPTNNTSFEWGEKHKEFYNHVLDNVEFVKNDFKDSIQIVQHFVGRPYLEITGKSNDRFKVHVYDGPKLVYNNIISSNSWIKLDREYYTEWTTIIRKVSNNKQVYNDTLNLYGKRVYIAFDSASLGDTIAWIPYVLEFKKKHGCKVIVSTFKNFLFEDVYPELEFVNPGTEVPNTYAMYKLGWFYNINKEPVLPNTIPLQQAATNILGLPYEEIVPRIKSDWGNKMEEGQAYVTIATNSTAGCKFWTREGWQEVINFLNEKGYKVINTSIEDNPFDNCEKISDTSIGYTIDCIRQSELFIGLSSGLSWLAWALGKEVVMISNFTEADHEFSCHRIIDTSLCHGCWNNPNHKFDKGDWDWCPEHKNTPRHFECHRGIPASRVIETVSTLLGI